MSAPYLLVLAHQRSGTNHLLDLLRGCAGVTTLGEFFNITASAPGKMHQADALAQYSGSVEQFVQAAERNPLDTLLFRENLPDTTLFVIKLFGNQLKSKQARQILIANAVGVIHLRRNVFGTWVSLALAKQSGEWFNESSEQRRVTFASGSFIRYGSRITAFAVDFSRMLRRSGQPFIDMTFSEVSSMNQPQHIVDRISSVFHDLPKLVKRDDWEPMVARQDTRLPIDRVDNAAFAQSTLKDLGLEYLLNNEDTHDTDFLHSVITRRRSKRWWRVLRKRIRRR
jgi:LPS sulfotransferase NodH